MKLTDRAAVPAQVMARQVGDELVILDLDGGMYFGLDPVGARVWALLAEGRAVGEACETLLDEYEVERERLLADVSGLLDALVGHGLIRIEAR